MKQKGKSNAEDDEDEDHGYDEDEDPTNSDYRHVDFRDYYKMRRLNDRLSFDNLRHLMHAAENSLFEGQDLQYSPNDIPDANLPSPIPNKPNGRKHKSHHRHTGRRRESAIDREDEYDYLPKRSNWSHFEHFNEDDVRNGIVLPGPSPSGTNRHYQAFSNGYNKEYAIVDGVEEMESSDADDDPTESSADEPQFVWMEATREPKSSKNKKSRIPKAVVATEDTKQPHLPEALPLEALTSTASAELPPPGAVRFMTCDSQATLPTQNFSNAEKMPDNFASSTTSGEPITNGNDHRAFLRHANSIGADSPPDSRWLPQRFAPASQVKGSEKMPRRYSSGLSTVSSEASASSGLLRIPQSNNRSNHSDDLFSSSHRSARAQYNAKIMPNKVVMIRHGQSMGNINEELYSTTPDNAMPLTKLGWDQARKAGQHLKNNVLAPLESVHFIVSPYARTVETFHGIVSAWCDPDSPEFASIPNREMRLKAWYGRLLEMGLTWHEDPRIREQDFGNYQDPEIIRKAKADRHRFGAFYYRFPHGESASDVFDRVSTFLDSLWRSFDMNRSRNYVLVTHGISIRVLLARYFRYTIHQFNMLSNPRNCEMIILNHDGYGRLRLQGRCQLHLKEIKGVRDDDDEKKKKEDIVTVDEYKFYKRLRILPQAAIRKVPIRISYNDGATKEGTS